MELQVLIDPSDVKNRAVCNVAQHHSVKLRERGWKPPEDLHKDQLSSLAKKLGLSLGAASKSDTMARAITERILNPPKKNPAGKE